MMFRISLIGVIAALSLSGCMRRWMYDQPKYKAFQENSFFKDNASNRPLVAGTVARGHLDLDDHLYRGKVNGKTAESFPFKVTEEVLSRGKERFEIFCSVCHGYVGNADGMIVQRGYKQPPSFHIDRLRQSPPGYFFDVITNGFGTMPSYKSQINKVQDRWAIAAYIKALQLSQRASLEDVPAEYRQKLQEADGPILLDQPAAPAHGEEHH